jgi:pentatricopeptide repeat domain-containing protein 1
LGRSGKTDQALQIYYNLDQPTVRHMNGAIDACARARPTRLDTAFEILEQQTHNTNKDQPKGYLKPNVFTFGALMNACNRARDGQRAIELLRSMEKTYGVRPNEVVYSAAISACARSKPPQTKHALQLLKEAVEERKLAMSAVGFNACISACAQASDWENAISLLSRMEEASQNRTNDDGESLSTNAKFLVPEPDAVTYGTVLAACERGQQWRMVLKFAQSMQDRGLTLDGLSFTSCLHACAELGLAKNALDFLDKMKSLESVAPNTARFERYGAKKPLSGPDAVAYRCAITACARGGEWEEGIRLLEECKSVTGTAPNVVAYTAAITGCEYAGEWIHAFRLLDRMRKEGVEPNELTMVAVIGACATAIAKSSAHTEIEDNLDLDGKPVPQQKALKLLNALKNDPSTVDPNIQIYNACIRTCAEARDVQGAFELLKEVTDTGLNKTQVTYGSLMTACERVGDVRRASRVFERMKDDGITPNEVIYGAAISCCRKANDPQRALWLLKRMIQEELLPNAATLNTVLIAQTDNRSKADSSRILQLYKLMNSKYVAQNGRPNRQTYNIIVNFFASTMQPAMAERFIDKMREAGYKPDVDLFTATVTAYERTQQPMKAVKLMKRMEEDGYDFYSVNVLNSAFKKAVGLVNAVGQSFTSNDDRYTLDEYSDIDDDDYDGAINDDDFVP